MDNGNNIYSCWIDTLSNIELFDTIKKDELNSMLLCLRPNIKTYNKNDHVANEGDYFQGIGIVVDGEVIVTKQNSAGNRVFISNIEKGNIFGEVMAFSNTDTWGATVIATKKSTILFLVPDKIIGNCPKMCLSHKILIQNMLKIFAKKALHLNQKVEYLALKNIRMKISTYLLEQYKNKEKLSFVIPIKRNDLADFLSVPRPSLSRELSKMKKEGIIDFHKSSFTILDLNSLKDCIN